MNTSIKSHIVKSLDKGLRLDSRKPLDYRKVTVETGVTKTAHGSARVKIGDTEVLAGVKMEVNTPYPDSPNEGSMMIGAEFLPLSSPNFESGPPSIDAIELARVVDRGIRESKSIDTKKLCIKKGEAVWMVVVDICTINVDGNLFDASALAVLAAIMDTTLPKLDADNKILHKEPRTKNGLPLTSTPVSITVGKIGNHFIVDPTPVEEKVFDARLTVAVRDDDTLCAMQKGGEGPLSVDDVSKIIDITMVKSKELRKLLKK